jgi:tRNA (cmo5U34)-methyltransferase
MREARVKDHFEQEAATYVDHILKFIPEYAEQNELMMELLPFGASDGICILDLGAGPGVLSGLALRRLPNARAHVFDLAENMLAGARNALKEFAGRVTFQKGDFGEADFGSGYDLVLSGLAVHHLEDGEKRILFRRIFSALNPDGLLLIRDIVRGETDRLNEQYERLWCSYIRSMNEDDRSLMDRYHDEDVPATVEDQMAWLREAGFTDVGCHWRRLNFAIFGGRKPLPVEKR